MMNESNIPLGWQRRWATCTVRLLCSLLMMALISVAFAAAAAASENTVWPALKKAQFGDEPIVEDDDVVALDAPYRAEDPAVVPIRITDLTADDPERRIEALWLVIDNNPVPMSAHFSFGPGAMDASLATRVRVNAYTPMRVIARTEDGTLHMAQRYVKASGGCSAPISRDPEAARRHMGDMRLRWLTDEAAGSTRVAQLMIRHPNITGLQMDQVTRLVEPAHYVNAITVTRGGAAVFDATMTFSLSENPSLRFHVRPPDRDASTELKAVVHDNENNTFEHSWPLAAATAGPNDPEKDS